MKTVSRLHALGAILFCLVLAVALFLFGLVPLFGLVAFSVWPTLALVTLSLIPGAIVTVRRPISIRGYLLTIACSAIALTLIGAALRARGAASGSEGVHIDSTVARRIEARIKEPVRLESITTIAYDTVLFETAGPWCDDPCILVQRIDQWRRIRWEEPKDVLVRTGVEPISDGSARIAVEIRTHETGNRMSIDIDVRDADAVTATLSAVVPSADHVAHFLAPRWVHYVLENNPLLALVMPRRDPLDATFITAFLKRAIAVQPQETQGAGVRIVTATITSRKVFDPPARFDRSSKEFVQMNWLHKDPRCESIVDFEGNGQYADYFVTFHRSNLPAPQARFADGASPICAGDSVYRRVIQGGGPGSWLRFERYRLDGEFAETLHIQIPAQDGVVPRYVEHPFFEPASLVEKDGRLTFRVRKVHFEWAKDASGKRVDRDDGMPLEYGFVEEMTDYEADIAPRQP